VCGDRAGGRRSILDAVEINRRGGQPSRIADSLEGLAAVALADDHPAVAARALTAATAVRSTVGTTLFPGFVRLVDDLVRRSRERLGDEAYAAARTEALQWSPRDALDRTLGALAES
jgi:hypothetical protein